jgi:hypothetical protein
MFHKASAVCARAFIDAVIFPSAELALFVLPAAAEQSLATILAPADGAVLAAKQTYKLEYEVQPAPKVDHGIYSRR